MAEGPGIYFLLSEDPEYKDGKNKGAWYTPDTIQYGGYVHKCYLPGDLNKNYIYTDNYNSFYSISNGKINTIRDLFKYGFDMSILDDNNRYITKFKERFERNHRFYKNIKEEIDEIGLTSSKKSKEKLEKLINFMKPRDFSDYFSRKKEIPSKLHTMVLIFIYFMKHRVKDNTKKFPANYAEQLINKIVSKYDVSFYDYAYEKHQVINNIDNVIISALSTKKGLSDFNELIEYIAFHDVIYGEIPHNSYYYFRDIFKKFDIFGVYRDYYSKGDVEAEEVVIWDPSLIKVSDIKYIDKSKPDKEPEFNKYVSQGTVHQNQVDYTSSFDSKKLKGYYGPKEITSYDSKNKFSRF